MTRREDAAPILADLQRQRADAERHIERHRGMPDSYSRGAREAITHVDQREGVLYRWVAEED